MNLSGKLNPQICYSWNRFPAKIAIKTEVSVKVDYMGKWFDNYACYHMQLQVEDPHSTNPCHYSLLWNCRFLFYVPPIYPLIILTRSIAPLTDVEHNVRRGFVNGYIRNNNLFRWKPKQLLSLTSSLFFYSSNYLDKKDYWVGSVVSTGPRCRTQSYFTYLDHIIDW